MGRTPNGAYPRVIPVNVDEDTFAAVAAAAEELDRSLAWIGRTALRAWLADRGPTRQDDTP